MWQATRQDDQVKGENFATNNWLGFGKSFHQSAHTFLTRSYLRHINLTVRHMGNTIHGYQIIINMEGVGMEFVVTIALELPFNFHGEMQPSKCRPNGLFAKEHIDRF